MALLCAALVVFSVPANSQGHQVHNLYSKSLPAESKPSIVPVPLKGRSVISAGEYLIQEQNVMRVYRYSFKGNVDKFVNAAMPQLKGWRKDVVADNVGKPQPGEGYSLTGPLLTGKMRRQTMLVTKGRFVLDAKATFGSRKEMTPGWISVSLNEDQGRRS